MRIFIWGVGGLIVFSVLMLVAAKFPIWEDNSVDNIEHNIPDVSDEASVDGPKIGDSPDLQDNIIRDMNIVTIETNKGVIKFQTYNDDAPKTVENFTKLAKDGFYDGVIFHRIIDGFMIQGGDPNSKGDDPSTYGTGGPGYTIEDEFVEGLSNVRGTISMANIGQPNTGGSQFFITEAATPWLDGRHSIFGQVTGGIEVVKDIARVSRDARDKPLDPVKVEEIVILNK